MSAYEPEDVEAVASKLRPIYRDRGQKARARAETILRSVGRGDRWIPDEGFTNVSVTAAVEEARLRLAGRKALREEGDG